MRLPTPMAAEVRVRVGVRAPKRPSAAFLLRAGAKLTENDGKTFSNFSRCAKIEAPTRGLPFRARSSRFRAPRRVKKKNLKKVLYRGDGVHMALTQPLSVVAPRGSLSYPTDRRPSLAPAKTAGKWAVVPQFATVFGNEWMKIYSANLSPAHSKVPPNPILRPCASISDKLADKGPRGVDRRMEPPTVAALPEHRCR